MLPMIGNELGPGGNGRRLGLFRVRRQSQRSMVNENTAIEMEIACMSRRWKGLKTEIRVVLWARSCHSSPTIKQDFQGLVNGSTKHYALERD